MLRRMQQQKGLMQRIEKRQLEKLADNYEWQGVVGERQSEVLTQTLGVGVYGAQSCTPVVRLRPEVNHLYQQLSEYARNVRAISPHAKLKSPRLLRKAQAAIARAVGPERIALIKEAGGPVKIVSDAPLELLPIDGLPLSLRYDTSRINATPGNLMMGQLTNRTPVTILHDDLNHILICSSFQDADPLRDEMANAVDALMRALPGRFRIEFARVSTVDELVGAMNSSAAPIMVFDGHGARDDGRGIGGLQIGTEIVDIWALRSRTKCPPIVILSACDTHGLDAPSHATVGNSFLALGATTVLGTILPVGGRESALFVYRLLLHLAEFVPSAIRAGSRALTWTEIMAGSLRLTVSKDIIDHLKSRRIINDEMAQSLFHEALLAVVEGGPAWFETLTNGARALVPLKPDQLADEIQAGIARSEAIRYVQLGMPEHITVANRELIDAFYPASWKAD